MRNALIIALGIGLIVTLIFNAGLQTAAQEDYVSVKKLLKLHGDEVERRLETQDALDRETDLLEHSRGCEKISELQIYDLAKEHTEVLEDLDNAVIKYKHLQEMFQVNLRLLAETREELRDTEESWEISYYFTLDIVYGIDWLREEATKAQIKRWFAGDETDMNNAIIVERNRRTTYLEAL